MWRIYYPEGTFSDPDEKKQLAERLTKFYTRAGLPPFYVGVFFNKMPQGEVFRGGEMQVRAKLYISIFLINNVFPVAFRVKATVCKDRPHSHRPSVSSGREQAEDELP